MSVERIRPRHIGITKVPGRVRIKVGKRFGPRERDALRAMFDALAGAPLARELEELARRIGVRLEELGFPPKLGFYEIYDPASAEPGQPGSWRQAPTPDVAGPADAEPQRDLARTATARHPALLRRHEGTEPWLLAKALRRLAEVRAHLDGTRPLTANDPPRALEHLVRASIWLGDHIRHAQLKQAVEEPALRAERDADRRRLGGKTTGVRKRAAAEPRRRAWRAEARAIWKRQPGLTTNRVANLVREKLAREGAPPAGQSTVWQAINDLNPGCLR